MIFNFAKKNWQPQVVTIPETAVPGGVTVLKLIVDLTEWTDAASIFQWACELSRDNGVTWFGGGGGTCNGGVHLDKTGNPRTYHYFYIELPPTINPVDVWKIRGTAEIKNAMARTQFSIETLNHNWAVAGYNQYTPTSPLFYDDAKALQVGTSPATARYLPYYTPESLPVCAADVTAPSGNNKALRWNWGPAIWNREPGGASGILCETQYDTVPTFVEGKSIYLGCYLKIERLAGDVWTLLGPDDEDFDKGLELNFVGGRWLLDWGSRYTTLPAGKFTFFCSSANAGGSGDPDLNIYSTNAQSFDGDMLFCNQNGYSKSNSVQCDYDMWIKLALELVLSKTGSGSIRLLVNNVEVLRYNNLFTIHPLFSGASNPYHFMFGTKNQPAYTKVEHNVWLDKFLITDSLTEFQAAGY